MMVVFIGSEKVELINVIENDPNDNQKQGSNDQKCDRQCEERLESEHSHCAAEKVEPDPS